MSNTVQVRAENAVAIFDSMSGRARTDLERHFPDLAEQLYDLLMATRMHPDESLSYGRIALLMSSWTTMAQSARVQVHIHYKALGVALDALNTEI